MKKRNLYGLLGMLIMISMIATACAKSDKSSENSTSYNYDMAVTTEDRMEAPQEAAGSAEYGFGKTSLNDSMAGEVEYESKENNSGEDGLSNTADLSVNDILTQSQDKIIRRFFLDVETQQFDSLITRLDSEINRLGGYVETSQIDGKSLYEDGGSRYAKMIARIPRAKADEFVGIVDEKANVVNKQISTDNVTLEYADMESRKKSLQIEQERLFALLEKADSLESIITLESRLSDIRYQIQNYETQLKTYDNQVEYSTITLSIQEVERMTTVTEKKLSVGERIKTGFGDSMYRISESLKNFFVWFVVNLPYLIIWGIVITMIVIIIRRMWKKSLVKQTKPLPQHLQNIQNPQNTQNPNNLQNQNNPQNPNK